MRRVTKGAPELAAEMSAREPGSSGEVVDAQRLEVPGVGEVLGAQQMSCRRWISDGPSLVIRTNGRRLITAREDRSRRVA
jgi:hypothetical protein